MPSRSASGASTADAHDIVKLRRPSLCWPWSGASWRSVVDDWMVGLVVFACVFGGALLGILLRRKLPTPHFSDESKDAVKVGMGLVATMSALVLGLLVASANSAFQDQKAGLDRISATLILLDSALAEYGPETQQARQRLREIVTAGMTRIWPKDAAAPTISSGSTAEGESFHSLILALSPANDRQRELQSMALQT